MTMNFYMPTRLITGRNCICKHSPLIAKLGNRAILVTGSSAAKQSGALADVTGALEAEGIAWSHFDQISANPTLTSCQSAAQQAAAFRADFVIGIGGGSALDAAKAVAVLAANPGMSQQELYALQWPNRPLPIVCVGTTAGTGSEVTAVAVLTRVDGTKKSITHDALFPTLSITDPIYTTSMPDYFTRSTAIDALAHCIESYFNRKANVASQAWALEGVRTLLPQLEHIQRQGCSALTYENRAALYHGSIYGGLAISVTGTAFPHTMGYPLTEQFGIPHGIACAVFLPDFLAHSCTAEPALAACFFRSCEYEKDALLSLIHGCTPPFTAAMTTQQIQNLAPRWVNNRSIQNSPGIIDQSFIAALYQKYCSH